MTRLPSCCRSWSADMTTAISRRRLWVGASLGLAAFAASAYAQEPAKWSPSLEFHTFSIVAVDPKTRETGVAVTTRNPCVGNAVPWVRAGVGAVATQGGTRVEYGPDLLELLSRGVSPKDALDKLVAEDMDRERRQVGVIAVDGRSAQWTGSGQRGAENRGDWVAERSGPTFAVQGNSLVSPDVVDAVLTLEFVQRLLIRHVTTFAVRDWDLKNLAARGCVCERRVCSFHT